jgi:hypothetical protein
VWYLYEHGQEFTGNDPADPTDPSKLVPFDPNLLPLDPSQFKPAMFSQWQRLNALVSLRNSLPGGDAALLNVFALASRPMPGAAPVLSQDSGGALSGATYYVQVTYSSADGEGPPSSGSTLPVSAGNLLQVASPASPAEGRVVGWNVYVSTSTGLETKQNLSPIPLGTAWSEPATGIVSGALPPAMAQAVVQATGWNQADLLFLVGKVSA